MAEDSHVSELLEDDSFAENDLLAVEVTTLRHSATTDTLDSVLLETSPLDDDLQDDSTTLESAEDKGDSIVTVESSENGLSNTEGTKEGENINNSSQGPVNISSYFTADVSNGKSADPFSDIGESFFDTVEQPQDKEQEAAFCNLDSSGPVSNEDIGQTAEVDVSGTQPAVTSGGSQDSFDETQPSSPVDKETSGHHEHLETRLSHEEPESVDFQVVPEDNAINVMEASLQVIDDKENFEAFTAEADFEIEPDYSISPSNKFLTEKVSQLHLTDPIPIDPIVDNVPVSYDRQYSSSSQGVPSVPSPVHQPFQGAPIPPQLSPFATPSHQPHLGSSPTNHAELALEALNQEEQKMEKTEPRSVPYSDGLTAAFPSLPDNNTDDPFTASLQMSETDRRYDAWLPSDATRSILVTIATSVPGSFIPTPEQLSCPGIIVDEPQGDPVRDLVHRYMGEQEAIKRQILTVDSVTQDIDGLKKLMAGGCYRSAVELSGRLLTEDGQGQDKVGEITQHNPQSLQLWFCRLSLMMKMKLYNVVESEIQAFQGMDTPDLYYEFYPHLYPGRKGSIVPFGLRVLHAELPHYLGRSQEALDRLHYLLAVSQKIIKNLDDGMSEDGSAVEIGEESRKVSRELWCNREKQILYIIGNTFLSIKDYESAMTVYEALLSKDPPSKPALLSGIGLMYLQMGNVEKATDCFKQAEILSDRTDKKTTCRTYVNRGLEAMCTNSFSEAYQCFKTAVDNDPTNASAVNNMAVCSLYLGKLRDALKTLEVLVHENPSRNLHEGVLFNLCTLYELESSRALHKKQALLDLVSRHKGDGFPVACLKMA